MAYSTINKSSVYQNQVLYTGNGSAGNAQTGVGFKPDLVWTKRRDNTGDHSLFDAVRGVTKMIKSNSNGQESTVSGVTAFDSDGFTLGAGGDSNGNNETYASWNWKAGTGQGSSNTDGSINTTYTSVNTTAGFSISKYTGTGSNATVGHGLGVAPKIVIIKKTSGADDWKVYHASVGATKSLVLQGTNAETSDSTSFNSTAPTTSVFSVGTSSATNTSGQTYIAYCFAEKTGYSKFGSYQGNNNSNGSFCYLGFKASFIMVKSSSAGGSATYSWSMFDNKRTSYNGQKAQLEANTNDAEVTDDTGLIDILSNGFKLRYSPNDTNGNNTYIYMAFGQSLVGSNNVPCTAR